MLFPSSPLPSPPVSPTSSTSHLSPTPALLSHPWLEFSPPVTMPNGNRSSYTFVTGGDPPSPNHSSDSDHTRTQKRHWKSWHAHHKRMLLAIRLYVNRLIPPSLLLSPMFDPLFTILDFLITPRRLPPALMRIRGLVFPPPRPLPWSVSPPQDDSSRRNLRYP